VRSGLKKVTYIESACDRKKLVAIQERIVLSDVVEVRRRHLKEILVKELASEGRLRHRDGGVQQTDVSDAFHTLVALDQAAVRPQQSINFQEQRQQ